jgi:alpha-ketoglutarate-dependent taurine dioxygenase
MLGKGLEDSPDFDTPDVRQAAKQLMHSLEHAPEELAMTLQDDSMVMADNHRAVHARTAFRDRERSLFRVRFHSKKRAG